MDDLLESMSVEPATLTDEQRALATQHMPLVKRLAYYMLAHLPKTVALDDLIQAGMIGLLEAVRHYDATRGAQFETYANIRIRGCILDEVRRNDWVPRSVYRHARMLEGAIKVVENRLGRPAKDHEIAEELNVTLQDYYELQKDSLSSQLCSLDALEWTEDGMHRDLGVDAVITADSTEQDDFMHQLSQVINNLPKNERLVLYLYYEHDLNLKEIGEVLGVSESRVSQIHTQATSHVKEHLEDPED